MKRLSAVSRIRCLVAAGARELASGTTLSRDAAVGASNGAFRSDIDFFREDLSHLNVRLNRTLDAAVSQPGSTLPSKRPLGRVCRVPQVFVGTSADGLAVTRCGDVALCSSAFDRAAPRALNWSDCRSR